MSAQSQTMEPQAVQQQPVVRGQEFPASRPSKFAWVMAAVGFVAFIAFVMAQSPQLPDAQAGAHPAAAPQQK